MSKFIKCIETLYIYLVTNKIGINKEIMKLNLTDKLIEAGVEEYDACVLCVCVSILLPFYICDVNNMNKCARKNSFDEIIKKEIIFKFNIKQKMYLYLMEELREKYENNMIKNKKENNNNDLWTGETICVMRKINDTDKICINDNYKNKRLNNNINVQNMYNNK